MSIVILDFGSQYTRLIARRIRELEVYSVIMPAAANLDAISEHDPEAIILSGGPGSVFDADAPMPDERIFELGVPILGICYGMQYLARHFGGNIARTENREYGRANISGLTGALFEGIDEQTQVWMSHSDTVKELPAGWRSLATSEQNLVAAIEAESGLLFGVQFHPEVVHTPQGAKILGNFLRLAGVNHSWTAEHTLELMIHEIREQVGDKRVLLGISGGVDSSTLAMLLARAGVDHLAVFIDHGLLRQGERAEVESSLSPLGINLLTVDGSELFLRVLQGISDPEQKRKAIGDAFISVLSEKAQEYGPFPFLAQGTLYPDVIESAGSEGSVNIKSHHNVGGLPKQLGFRLLEPFRYLFKDEVRKVAGLVGLPDSIRFRHPYPGPGLAIRILGEVTPKRLRILRRADHLFVRALRDWGLYDDVWQALAVLTSARSVGVIGDDRDYGYVLAIRAVTSVDGMTADWSRFDTKFLDEVSRAITAQVPEIGRVVYDITSKPPSTIEWE